MVGENVVETVVARFVADVEDGARSSPPAERACVVVGRAIEMGVLRKAFRDVCSGRRSVAFVSGEPGVGKSTLVDAFLDDTIAHSPVWIARCVCLEPCAEGERSGASSRDGVASESALERPHGGGALLAWTKVLKRGA